MNMNKHKWNAQIVLVLFALMAAALIGRDAEARDLDAGFANPPGSSGIRCFWYWLNGNVTKEALTRDLEEMKDKGFSGAAIFDGDNSFVHGNSQVPGGAVFGDIFLGF